MLHGEKCSLEAADIVQKYLLRSATHRNPSEQKATLGTTGTPDFIMYALTIAKHSIKVIGRLHTPAADTITPIANVGSFTKLVALSNSQAIKVRCERSYR